MTDLVARLRSHVACEGGDLADVEQAADELARLRAEVEALRADAERYRWLRANNAHYLHNRAWLNSVTATKDGPCDIFSADEVPALLDAEVDRRIDAARKA